MLTRAQRLVARCSTLHQRAVMSNRSTRLLILFVVLLLSEAGMAETVIRPRNIVTIEYTPVTLHCRTAVNDRCHWVARKSLIDTDLTISNGNQTEDRNQYSVNRSQPGQCDLTIWQPDLTSPQVYGCTNDGSGDPSYAFLNVLKSNPLCAHNVKAGTIVVRGQTVRYSFHQVYHGDMDLAVYLERPDGSVEEICSGVKKDGNVWRLECDYTVAVNNGSNKFFAGVSNVSDAEGLELDKTVPTERFYCSINNDWLAVTDELEQSSANTTSNNATVPCTVATDKACAWTAWYAILVWVFYHSFSF